MRDEAEDFVEFEGKKYPLIKGKENSKQGEKTSDKEKLFSAVKQRMKPHKTGKILLWALGLTAALVVFSLMAAPFSRLFRYLGFYVVFFTLWVVLLLVIAGLIEVIAKIISWGTAISGGLAAYFLFIKDDPQTGVPLAIVSIIGLAVILGVILAFVVPIFGPGILAGLGIYHGLGETGGAEILGIIAFIIVTGVCYFIVLKILAPFFMGAGLGFISGTIAYRLSALLFSVRLGSYYWNHPSEVRGLRGLLALLEDFFKIGSFNTFLVILGSVAIGLIFIVATWKDEG